MPSKAAQGRREKTGPNGEGTKERILDTAAGLFLERGYDGTSMSAIAKVVGISTPALYWHFDSKKAILYEFMEANLRDFAEAVQAGTREGREPPERLSGFVRAHVLSQLTRRSDNARFGMLYNIGQLTGSLPQRDNRVLVEIQRQILDTVRGTLIEGKEAGVFQFKELTPTAFAILTMCDFVFTWARPDGDLTPDEVADVFARLALNMVAVRPADSDSP